MVKAGKSSGSGQSAWRRSAVAAAVLRLRRSDPPAVAVMSLVASACDVELTDLLQHSRCQAQIAFARQLAMYLINVKLGRNMTEIGQLFGRDRTTVSHACALLEDRREGEFEAGIDALEAAIDAALAGAQDVSAEVCRAAS
jgi:chromosomal replication initiation ATPase DnaA